MTGPEPDPAIDEERRPPPAQTALRAMDCGSNAAAAAEKSRETLEPLSFVVDDILIGFDDRRTKAALAVLAELSARTQVVLFTHHRRVVGLAGELGEAAGVFVQELA